MKISYLLCTLLVIAGCIEDGVLVGVSVQGAGPSVKALHIKALLNGQVVGEQELARTDRFRIRLDGMAKGTFRVLVAGHGGDSCYLEQGEGQLEVSGSGLLEMPTVVLGKTSYVPCQLEVDLLGPGGGEVISEPPGLLCTRQCQQKDGCKERQRCKATFAAGTKVKLKAKAEDAWWMSNWGGACSGTEDCSVQIGQQPTYVWANLVYQPRCSENWCQEHPRIHPFPPGGIQSYLTFSASDIWYRNGTNLQHWDGLRWQEVTPPATPISTLWGSSPNNFWICAGSKMWKWNGKEWGQGYDLPAPFRYMFRMAGSQSGDVWGIGIGQTQGTYFGVLFFDGTQWKSLPAFELPPPFKPPIYLHSISGSGPRDIWVTTHNQHHVGHWNGVNWTSFDLNVTALGVWANNPNDAWVVGSPNLVQRWNGSKFDPVAVPLPPGESFSLWDVAGSGSSNVWMVGPAGTIFRWDGGKLVRLTGITEVGLHTVFAKGPNDVWMVGDGGVFLHWDGSKFEAIGGGVKQTMRAIWAANADDAWVVGDDGWILHWDGVIWSKVPVTANNALKAVAGCNSENIWALGDKGIILKKKDTSWLQETSGTGETLHGGFCINNMDVWAVGENGTILHRNGATWSRFTSNTTAHLYAIWGSTPSDIWVVGDKGTILHFDGKSFVSRPSGSANRLLAVWGPGPNDVWVSGENATLLHLESQGFMPKQHNQRGTLRSIWGSSPADVWIAGQNGLLRFFGGMLEAGSDSSIGVTGIHGAGTDTVWIVGAGGGVFRYRPEGSGP